MDIVLQAKAGSGFGQRCYRIEPRHSYEDPYVFVRDATATIRPFFEMLFSKSFQPYRFQLCMKASFEKIDGTECKSHFNTKFITLLAGDDLTEVLSEAMGIMHKKLEDFQEMGSGWVVQNVEHMDMHIGEYHPLARF